MCCEPYIPGEGKCVGKCPDCDCNVDADGDCMDNTNSQNDIVQVAKSLGYRKYINPQIFAKPAGYSLLVINVDEMILAQWFLGLTSKNLEVWSSTELEELPDCSFKSQIAHFENNLKSVPPNNIFSFVWS